MSYRRHHKGLALGICLLATGCGDAEPIDEYIRQVQSTTGRANLSPPAPQLSSLALPLWATPSFSYQAQTARNPFYWSPAFSLSAPASSALLLDDPPQRVDENLGASLGESAGENLGKSAGENLGKSAGENLGKSATNLDCKGAPLAALVLRATFNDSHGGQSGTSALIEVEGAGLYTVKQGQQLIAKFNNAAVAKSLGKGSGKHSGAPHSGNKYVAQNLGMVLAINPQSLTFKLPDQAGCVSEPLLVLTLYD